MINFVIPLVESWLPMWDYLILVFALAFVATVPCIVRRIFRDV